MRLLAWGAKMKIRVTFEPGEVNISFIHHWRPITTIGVVDGATEAKIEWGAVCAHGTAKLHPKDLPVRAIGRKIALARAMLSAGFTREERTQIWAGLKEKGMRLE